MADQTNSLSSILLQPEQYKFFVQVGDVNLPAQDLGFALCHLTELTTSRELEIGICGINGDALEKVRRSCNPQQGKITIESATNSCSYNSRAVLTNRQERLEDSALLAELGWKEESMQPYCFTTLCGQDYLYHLHPYRLGDAEDVRVQERLLDRALKLQRVLDASTGGVKIAVVGEDFDSSQYEAAREYVKAKQADAELRFVQSYSSIVLDRLSNLLIIGSMSGFVAAGIHLSQRIKPEVKVKAAKIPIISSFFTRSPSLVIRKFPDAHGGLEKPTFVIRPDRPREVGEQLARAIALASAL